MVASIGERELPECEVQNRSRLLHILIRRMSRRMQCRQRLVELLVNGYQGRRLCRGCLPKGEELCADARIGPPRREVEVTQQTLQGGGIRCTGIHLQILIIAFVFYPVTAPSDADRTVRE